MSAPLPHKVITGGVSIIVGYQRYFALMNPFWRMLNIAITSLVLLILRAFLVVVVWKGYQRVSLWGSHIRCLCLTHDSTHDSSFNSTNNSTLDFPNKSILRTSINSTLDSSKNSALDYKWSIWSYIETFIHKWVICMVIVVLCLFRQCRAQWYTFDST